MNSRALDELLPHLPDEELQARLRALRDALGARVLGIARCLHANTPQDSQLVFRVLQVVNRNGPVQEPETALPLGGYRQLFLEARTIAVHPESTGAIGRWLRCHGGGGLVGWPFPGDRLPCVAFLAGVADNWQPGELRLRVAREGMEALARSLSPPTWLLRSGVSREGGPVSRRRLAWGDEQSPNRGSAPSIVRRELSEAEPEAPRELSREEIQRREGELIRRALRRARGNKSKAARALHLSRQVLYRKLKIHGILVGD